MITRLRVVLLLALTALAACECDDAARVRTMMCSNGDIDSCEWLAEHIQGGACVE